MPKKTKIGLPHRMLRWIGIYLCIPYFSVTVIFAILQRKLIYQPTKAADLSVTACDLPNSVLDVQLKTNDGLLLNGWLWRASNTQIDATRGLVLYFPGNAGNRYERRQDLREIADIGFDVLIVDYRGFGDNPGKPSQWALEQDARALWTFACRDLEYAPSQIIVFGESLGGAVALSMWSDKASNTPKPAGVLLNSTFSSMSEVVAWHYP